VEGGKSEEQRREGQMKRGEGEQDKITRK